MMASDVSSSQKRFHSRNLVDLDRMCGSIFEGINAVLRAFCAMKALSATVGQRSATVGLQQLYCEVCFIEYSFSLGIFDSLGFKIFALALNASGSSATEMTHAEGLTGGNCSHCFHFACAIELH